jgi:hypothetical protein
VSAQLVQQTLGLEPPASAAWPRPTVEQPGPEPENLSEVTVRADGAIFCTDWQGRNTRRFSSRGRAQEYQREQAAACNDVWNLWRAATLAPRLRPCIPIVQRQQWWLAPLGDHEQAAVYIESQDWGQIGWLPSLHEDPPGMPRFVVAFLRADDRYFGELWPDVLRWLVHEALLTDSSIREDWPEKHPHLLADISVAELEAFDLTELGVSLEAEE